MSDLGDRMKGYESVTHAHLYRRIPVIVRVDGKSFHSLPLQKPFDLGFVGDMQMMAVGVARRLQGFVFGYVQSDEVSFLLDDTKTLNSEPHFGYDIQKIASTTASFATGLFGRPGCFFDARAFNIPRDDAANYFLWRVRDWHRNSLQMFARGTFSQRELHGKGREEMHEMLHQAGKNWADLEPTLKNGTAFDRNSVLCDGICSFAEIESRISAAYEAAGWGADEPTL